MKFSKHFPSSSAMSGFASHAGPQPSAASGSSAPSSALDIVQAQGVNTWDNLLSPVAETSTTTLPEDSDLMNSPNFLLGVPNYSPELDTTSTPTDPLSWDRLRPTTVSPTASSAYASTFSMMPMDAQNFASYPFGSYPLLPVLSAAPYEVSRNPISADEAPATVSPAAVSLSQVAPPPPPSAAPTPTAAKQEPSPMATKPVPASREASMEIDDDNEEGDYDDEDMGTDGEDEYRERVRAPRKDGKAARPAIGSTSRKADSMAAESSSGAKRAKASASKTTSGSEGPSTPTPQKRRGGTRISVADFVPPDVTGLSKREARLVKNRAAAFLSRQRKREEFEQMEIRLQEVLEENSRLKNGGSAASPAASNDEVQRLQELLRVAEEREQALKKELEEKTRLAEEARLQTSMKVEEPTMTVQEALKLATPMAQSPRSDISSLDGSLLSSSFKEKDTSRHGPGFNLMVLVFSLTLLGMPHQHQLQNAMRGAGAQPTRITYEPTGSATTSAFPSLFENVLERWESTSRVETLDGLEPVDEDDEMEVEVEPWEQEEPASESKKSNSYVVDFEMPVLADEVGKDEDGKIKVRISPVGVPRPRQATGDLKPGELAWDGSVLPPVDTASNTVGSSSFVADWETWGGWKEFLSDDLVGAGGYPPLMSDTLAPTASVDESSSPLSELEQSPLENNSDRWATPPPFPLEDPAKTEASLANVLSNEQNTPVDVDVSLSTLPAWSRALVHAAAGEKLKARIRVSKKSKIAGRSKNTLSLGKKKMGLVVKV